MEKQILDLLMKLDEKLSNIEKDQQELSNKIDKLNFKVNDGFETLEIKMDELDIKLRKTNKRISEQLAETMEDIAELKLQ